MNTMARNDGTRLHDEPYSMWPCVNVCACFVEIKPSDLLRVFNTEQVQPRVLSEHRRLSLWRQQRHKALRLRLWLLFKPFSRHCLIH